MLLHRTLGSGSALTVMTNLHGPKNPARSPPGKLRGRSSTNDASMVQIMPLTTSHHTGHPILLLALAATIFWQRDESNSFPLLLGLFSSGEFDGCAAVVRWRAVVDGPTRLSHVA
jgi:hypothetical protein